MKRIIILFELLLFSFCLTSCGSDTRDRENYGDLSQPAGAIILNDRTKHEHGWGRKDCLICHNAALNIHQRPGAGLDVDALNQAIRDGGESTFCLTCHGSNGLTP